MTAITASEAFSGSVGLLSSVDDLLTFLEANVEPPPEFEDAIRSARTPESEEHTIAWQRFAPTGRSPLYAVSDASFTQRRLGLDFTFQADGRGNIERVRLSGALGEERTQLVAPLVCRESPPAGVVAGNAGFAVTFNRLQNRVFGALTRTGVAMWMPLGVLVGVVFGAIWTRRRRRRP